MNRLQRRLDEFSSDGEPSPPAPPAAGRPHPPGLPGIWGVEEGLVRHPLIAAGALRALPFQLDLARIGVAEDLLVVLPTGMGKTAIAGLVAAERLRAGAGKVVFLAPTRPLVDQHAESFGRWIPDARRARFTGTVRSPVREGGWESADVVFATPQILEHDLEEKLYSLRDVDLLIFDEAHRAVGRYAYVSLAERYRLERPIGGKVLALTASPGAEPERIEGVIRTLGTARVESRSRTDEGVREHVHPVEVETRWVKLPPVAQSIQEALVRAAHAEGVKLQRMGYLRKKPLHSLSVKDLIALRAEIFARPGPMTRRFGPLYHQLVLLHLHHLSERLETQGVGPFLQYLERLEAKPKPSKGDRAVAALAEVKAAREQAETFLRDSGESSHPKLDLLAALVEEELARAGTQLVRILVFAQYRDTIQGIQTMLEKRGHRVARFVGQATRDRKDLGMNQKEQRQVLQAFREGRFPILVASSVGEEGIDVPDVDVVVFFEAVPSEIRAIQRRGRTGRTRFGRVVLLLTEGTRDVGYQRAEVRREHAMHRVIRGLSRRGRRKSTEAPPAPETQPTEGAGIPGRI
ncbi:MAG: DEAD/DEAH box helicase [Thermoplasmata archaeon]|nr:DEAD/DEAH box helicase [Thermoplasmata archaeon]